MFNSVILVGNLTRDPEVRYISTGTAVCDVGLAVNDRRKVGDEWKEETTFVDITFWGRTAEVMGEYCSKGQQILVNGKLKLDTWQDADGNKRSKLKVVGNEMKMLGSKKDGGSKSAPQNDYSGSTDDVDVPTIADDDIPF